MNKTEHIMGCYTDLAYKGLLSVQEKSNFDKVSRPRCVFMDVQI